MGFTEFPWRFFIGDVFFIGFTDGLFSGTSWRFNGDVSGIQASQNAKELGFKQLRQLRIWIFWD
jgi:hypothetical protein